MRASSGPENGPLYEYTLMPTRIWSRFRPEELNDAELAAPFRFTKGVPTLRVRGHSYVDSHGFGTLLYDLEKDPAQSAPIADEVVEFRMIELMLELMRQTDAPP
jgi:hypothetical protein